LNFIYLKVYLILLVQLFLCVIAIDISFDSKKFREKKSSKMADWLLNQEKKSDFETNGNKVTFKYEPNQFNYFNAMYLGICANERGKKYYWEFSCTEGRPSIGVTKKDAFADGYKISGCFFNGNLSDGSCLLVGEFGDSIKNGDKIGLILDLEETELKIYIVQNDRPLGLAFVHSAPYANELHPVVSFSSPGSVEINEKEAKELDKLLIRTDYPKKKKKKKKKPSMGNTNL